MAVLIVLLVSWGVFRGIGCLGVSSFGHVAGFGGLRAGGDVWDEEQRALHQHEA